MPPPFCFLYLLKNYASSVLLQKKIRIYRIANRQIQITENLTILRWFWFTRSQFLFYVCKDIQSLLIICAFYTWEFTYSLKLICNFRINTCSAFMVIQGHAQSSENLSHQIPLFPAEVKRGNTLSSYFSSHSVNKYPFCGLLNTVYFFFAFWSFLLRFYCLKWSPSIALKRHLLFLNTGCGFPYTENTYVR